jgi:Asp-tRNAAsn/Glu-tRNAGln amidotransferase B subunit (PET112 homolog)
MDYDKALELFEPVIGLEIHVELSTQTKMFSDAPNPANSENHDAAPNTLITPVDLGLPGSLPVVNEKAVEYAISLGLALGCQIASSSRFARKNYFYPDLAKNYQISQYDEPIAFEGSVQVELEDGTLVDVPIERAHMEEDAGKLTHLGGATGRIHGAEASLVDYNRAGVPLVEIVTKPVFIPSGAHAGEVAKAYVGTIRDIVRALGVSEARMERGNLRCDANVSLSTESSPAARAVPTRVSQGSASTVRSCPTRTSCVASRLEVPVTRCTRFSGVIAPSRCASPEKPSSGRERCFTSVANAASDASTTRFHSASARAPSTSASSASARGSASSHATGGERDMHPSSQGSNACSR